MELNFTVQRSDKNTRLDTLVFERYPAYSRSRISGWIQSSEIRVNGRPGKPGYRVKENDVITGEIPDKEKSFQIAAQSIPLDIIYEDDGLIVINKRAGMVVHPATGHTDGTLVNALLNHFPPIASVGPETSRAGIVHRLDKDTSGLILVAKDQLSMDFLQKEFKYRRVEKHYLAIASGVMEAEKGCIDLPIARHRVKRKMMAVDENHGKPSVSLWTVKQQYTDATLVDVLLKTGRTHQIRVHFYAVGHPLIGDTVYQFRRNRNQSRLALRQMLHAHRISFRHPYSGRRLAFSCEPPGDFEKLCGLLANNT